MAVAGGGVGAVARWRGRHGSGSAAGSSRSCNYAAVAAATAAAAATKGWTGLIMQLSIAAGHIAAVVQGARSLPTQPMCVDFGFADLTQHMVSCCHL